MAVLVFEKDKRKIGLFKFPFNDFEWRFEFDPLMLFYQDPEEG